MNIYRQILLSFFLLAPSFHAFSCATGGENVYLDYNEIVDLRGEILCGFNSACNFENYLNKKYGANKWEYDDDFYIKYPEVYENHYVVPVTTGTKENTLAGNITAVSIFVEGQIFIKGSSKETQLIHEWERNILRTPEGKLIFEGKTKETQITKVAEIKFSKKSYLYYANRFNLNSVPTLISNIYAVYTSDSNKIIKVTKPPHSAYGTSCSRYIYVK